MHLLPVNTVPFAPLPVHAPRSLRSCSPRPGPPPLHQHPRRFKLAWRTRQYDYRSNPSHRSGRNHGAARSVRFSPLNRPAKSGHAHARRAAPIALVLPPICAAFRRCCPPGAFPLFLKSGCNPSARRSFTRGAAVQIFHSAQPLRMEALGCGRGELQLRCSLVPAYLSKGSRVNSVSHVEAFSRSANYA